MVNSNEFVYRKGGSYMDSLVKIIQNYAAIIGIIYLIAIYWNDFGKCLKKNNPTEEKIEISLLPQNTIYKFQFIALGVNSLISAIIPTFIPQITLYPYAFIIAVILLFILLDTVFNKFFWNKSTLNEDLYIKDPNIYSDLSSTEPKTYVYVTHDRDDKFIFKLVSKDITHSEYICVSKLDIFNHYLKHKTKK